MEVELLWVSTLERAESVGKGERLKGTVIVASPKFCPVLSCLEGRHSFNTSGAYNLINSQYLPNIHSYNPHSNSPSLAAIRLPFDR